MLPGGRLEPGETIPSAPNVRSPRRPGSRRFSGLLYVSEFLRDGRHTVDITVRMAPEGYGEAVLGTDPEVAPGSEPTLRELRWVGEDELRRIDLLPGSIKARLLEDAAGGWSPSRTYLGTSRD